MNKLLGITLFTLSTLSVDAQTFLEWAGRLGGNGNDNATSVSTDGYGNVYSVGYFENTADFDPGTGIVNLISNGGSDIFISKLDMFGNYMWSKRIGGTGNDKANCIKSDMMGNVYVTGYFENTVDFDPGPGTFNMTANQTSPLPTPGDAFVLKLDAAGNFAWAMQINGCYAEGAAITLDNYGNVYTSGIFLCTADFDPGPGIFNMTGPSTSSSGSGFILKLDTAGSFKWAKQFLGSTSTPGAKYCKVFAITTDTFGNVFSTGSFIGSVDFDPGTAVNNLTSFPQTTAYPPDAFVSKLDTAGNFVWVRQLGGSDYNEGRAISIDPSGNIYTAGMLYGSVDFDPAAAVFNLTALGASDIYVSKLNANGDFAWAKVIGGTGYDGSLAIQSDTAGYIYTTGYFESTVDFDPGAATFNLTGVSGDIFILKLNGQGNLVWAKNQGGSDADMASGLDVDPKGNVHIVGAFTGQADFDPGTAVYNLTSSGNLNDIFICKLSQDSCANLALSIDSLATIQCAHPGYISMNAAGGKMPYLYSWAVVPTVTAPAMTVNTGGVYQLTVTDNIGCTRTTGVLMSGYTAVSGFDMNVNVASRPFRPGFSSDIFADAYNDGCLPVNGLLKIVLPNEVVYNSAIPLPSQISGDTLIWSFSNNTYDSPHITPWVNVTTKSFVAIGDTICLLAIVTPVNGDINPANNVKTYCDAAISSFDPNDKHVYPAGDCAQGYVLFQTPLTYTVNFQNTGTVAARNVYIIDSLDADLDLNTVRVVGSSHPMITEVMPGHVLKFRFDNIFLPDSASDEPLSHGYVMFEAQHIQNISSGTQIRNRSEIHFDFNTPIITNEVLNTVVSTIPQCNNGIIHVNNTASLRLYPNPANNILTVEYPESGSLVLADVLGRIVADFELPGGSNKLVLNTQNLVPGVYIYKYLPKKMLVQTGKFTVVR